MNFFRSFLAKVGSSPELSRTSTMINDMLYKLKYPLYYYLIGAGGFCTFTYFLFPSIA